MAFSRRQIVFFHPDLGIGGAERLVVDAAVALQDRGHKVVVFTSHCDKTHCFEEARDGTLDVRVRGNSVVPHSIFGRFTVLCAILRQIHLVLQIAFFSKELQDLGPELFFVDQLSACIPLLRWKLPRARILFYCHFPDKLLASRRGLFKKLYRIPFDWLEGFSTGASDIIVVNSNFTKSIFGESFPGLTHRSPRVVYPCVDIDTKPVSEGRKSALLGGKKVLLSINRFERKKDVGLAIRAYAKLSSTAKENSRLVIAGGYDPRIAENVSYHKELCSLADSQGLSHTTLKDATDATKLPSEPQILFLLSIPAQLKAALLSSATVLIYTPEFEHFGIVPLEAMLARTPVLAADKGGPTETVVDGQTGWLRHAGRVADWAEVLEMSVREGNESLLSDMGARGRERVVADFSKVAMAQRLQDTFDKILAAKTRPIVLSDGELIVAMLVVIVVGMFGAFLGALVIRDRLSIRLDHFGDAGGIHSEL